MVSRRAYEGGARGAPRRRPVVAGGWDDRSATKPSTTSATRAPTSSEPSTTATGSKVASAHGGSDAWVRTVTDRGDAAGAAAGQSTEVASDSAQQPANRWATRTITATAVVNSVRPLDDEGHEASIIVLPATPPRVAESRRPQWGIDHPRSSVTAPTMGRRRPLVALCDRRRLCFGAKSRWSGPGPMHRVVGPPAASANEPSFGARSQRWLPACERAAARSSRISTGSSSRQVTPVQRELEYQVPTTGRIVNALARLRRDRRSPTCVAFEDVEAAVGGCIEVLRAAVDHHHDPSRSSVTGSSSGVP